MMMARVLGSVTATAKHPGLEGIKLLLIQPVSKDGNDWGRALVALDAVGAGYCEKVYWCRGREAALAFGDNVPTDASVVGIVDSVNMPQRANSAKKKA